MSDINNQKSSQSPIESSENENSTPNVPELIVNRKTNELVIKNTSGEQIALKTVIIDEDYSDNEDDEDEIISVEGFREALQKMNDLGLTFSADSPPLVRPKNQESEANLGDEEFELLQAKYPTLPKEITFVASYILTGSESFSEIVGGLDALKAKAKIAQELLITPEFRSEYFFKHAIKVPYLSDIDWEVVLKLREKNVKGVPAVAYGLVSLIFRESFSSSHSSKERHLTVAVNERSIDKFIKIFQEIKDDLKRSLEITQTVTAIKSEEENKDDESTTNKPVE